MKDAAIQRLEQVKTLHSLVKYLRDELDWPIESDVIDDLTFEYTPEELNVEAKHAAQIKEIKQLRPLETNQPWGIFWVCFDKKQLPIVMLRRVLGSLVIKRRAAFRKSERPGWHLHDLLFISSYGNEEHRSISFAHFKEEPDNDGLPVLRVLGWDDQNTKMHFDRVVNKLHSNLRWPDAPSDADKWRQEWSDAFTDRPREAIRSADELIAKLAGLAADIRQRVNNVLDAETKNGPMRRLFAAVQKLLIHDMTEDGFADMYAQTISYGLLSAAFSRPAGESARNLVQLSFVSNPFLEYLYSNLRRINKGKNYFDVDEIGITDVCDLLANTNIDAIKAAFSDKNPAEDPVIRFYEGFLKAYDSKQRVKRGVFFTPRPVVSYIVRSVHELLQTEFGLEDGLASTDTWADMKARFPELAIPKGAEPEDPFVCILDPATGTGTFLFECIEVIERAMKNKWQKELGCRDWSHPTIRKQWQDYVPAHLLPRLYGYELMMAPYAIAHLKLALKLGETGYQFKEGDRLHIYLTNSLEPPSQMADSTMADMFSELAVEAQEVQKLKREKRFTVVIGNPPYSKMSANLSQHAVNLVNSFRSIENVPIVERGALAHEINLQDDYVKFYGYMTKILDKSMFGVGSYISNFRYIDSRSLRGLRYFMRKQYEHVYILNLGGHLADKNTLEKVDDNVFEIEQGVAILLIISRNKSKNNFIKYGRMFGAKEDKFKSLLNNTMTDDSSQIVCPGSPFYSFKPTDNNIEAEYSMWLSLDEIFPLNSGCVITSRDNLTIDFDQSSLLNKIRRFASSSLSIDEIQKEIGFSVKSKWDVDSCRKALLSCDVSPDYVKPIMYRVFDVRNIYYFMQLIDTPSKPICRLILNNDNMVLLSPKVKTTNQFTHVFVTRLIAEKKSCSHDRATQMFPLWNNAFMNSKTATPNIKDNLLKCFISQSDERELRGRHPALIYFTYIYAILHSHGYRERYGNNMKEIFPRIPFAKAWFLTDKLVGLGNELISMHLMESTKLNRSVAKWNGCVPSIVTEKITYSDNVVWIDKAKANGFEGVPEDVWNFHIGGYQVCEKWLKDRKGRVLSAKDIEHYQKIVVALNETIRIMGEIDKVIDEHGGWPDAFITDPKVYEEIRNADPFR